jgi:putative transposase
MSRKVKYEIELTEQEKATLEAMTKTGNHSAREINRARILLFRDKSKGEKPKNQPWIAKTLGITQATVSKICQLYVQGGLDTALYDKPRSGRPQVLENEQKAKLTALACTNAPEGYEHWTHQLLADKFVQLEFAESVSASTIGRVLKKTKSNLGKKGNGVSVK